jgi:hypothetical protein
MFGGDSHKGAQIERLKDEFADLEPTAQHVLYDYLADLLADEGEEGGEVEVIDRNFPTARST